MLKHRISAAILAATVAFAGAVVALSAAPASAMNQCTYDSHQGYATSIAADTYGTCGLGGAYEKVLATMTSSVALFSHTCYIYSFIYDQYGNALSYASASSNCGSSNLNALASTNSFNGYTATAALLDASTNTWLDINSERTP